MIHKNDSSYRDLDCNDGDSIQCNLRQKYPHTPVCVGKTGLKALTGSCIINCDLPEGTSYGAHVYNPQISFCANIEKNEPMELESEPVDCLHSTNIGNPEEPIYTYENKVVQ